MSVLGMALEMLPHLKMQRLYAKAHGLFSPVPLQLKKDPTEAERYSNFRVLVPFFDSHQTLRNFLI